LVEAPGVEASGREQRRAGTSGDERGIVGVVPGSEQRRAGTSGDESAGRSTDRSTVADLVATALTRLAQGDVEAVREILQRLAETESDAGRGVA
jgi:hypothetical protein